MNTDYLKYFIDAAELQSITRAAAANNISQQGLSRAIRCLEQEFGVDLINHASKAFELTETGEAFLKKGRALAEDFRSLSDVMARHANRTEDQITNARIFTTPNFNRATIVPLLDFLSEHMPNVVPAIVETSFKEVVYRLMYDSTDNMVAIVALADRFLGDLEKTPLRYKPFMKVDLMVRVSQDSAYAKRSVITRDDLFYGTLALNDDQYLMRYLESILGWPYDIANNFLIQTNDSALLDKFITTWHAIGFSNSFEAIHLPQEGFVYLPLENPCEITFYFVYNRLVEKTPFTCELFEQLQAFAQRYPV